MILLNGTRFWILNRLTTGGSKYRNMLTPVRCLSDEKSSEKTSEKTSEKPESESETPPPPPPNTKKVKGKFPERSISSAAFPDVRALKNRRGTGGRSSFNGIVATVFGSTGLLARSVVNGLARIGSTVVCPYRGDPYFTKELKLAGDLGQIWFVPFHLKDESSLRRAMVHSNVVVNLIGRDNPTGNFSFEDVHVTGARTIARIAREVGVKRLVHVSALNSSPKPEAHYVRGGSNFLKSKYEGEQAVRAEYPDATIIRPADMYGVMDKYLWYYCQFYRRRHRRLPLHNGGYGITKTPISVSDVAQGIVNAITDPVESIGQTYDAVGPRRYELRMLMEYLQDVIMKTPENGGFKINNLYWDPLMRARISILTHMSKNILRNPKVTWEKIERECISDEKPKNPTLTELGVRLSYIEDKWPSHLSIWRFDWSYDGDLGEKKLFTNPPYSLDS